jgi:hypothetical protein
MTTAEQREAAEALWRVVQRIDQGEAKAPRGIGNGWLGRCWRSIQAVVHSDVDDGQRLDDACAVYAKRRQNVLAVDHLAG